MEKKANILGKICMDQCIVDLTDIKDVSMDSEVIFMEMADLIYLM